MYHYQLYGHEALQRICYKHCMQFNALLCYCACMDFLGRAHFGIYYLFCVHRTYMCNLSYPRRIRWRERKNGLKLLSSCSTWCHANPSRGWNDCSKKDEEKSSIFSNMLYKPCPLIYFNRRHTVIFSYRLLVRVWTLLGFVASSCSCRTQYNFWARC